MIYTVVTRQAAEDELILIWIRRVADRRAITAASHRIERALRQDADQKGVPLDDGSRFYAVSPLGATFEVSPDDCLVTITWYQEVS